MKQAAKKEDTKQRILDEALRLFSQSGYDAVSVERIASAVGIKHLHCTSISKASRRYLML